MQNLGDYSILKRIGQGCFGQVYLAEHRFLKKKYVVKVLSEEYTSDKEFLLRFEREISVLAGLDHPSIVKLHNISCANGHYFLVLDPMVNKEGDPLSLFSFLQAKSKPLTEMQLEMILRQLASALDYAHDIPVEGKFLVHRGLKLSNVYVEDNEKSLRAYLSDFGMSRIVGEGKVLLKNYEMTLRDLTLREKAEGGIAQKRFLQDFSFLSPEQKEGKEVDKKTDVFAFGVLTYYLITRKFPEGYFEMPSKVSPQYKLNWDLFVGKCLQRDPEKRPEKLTEALNLLLTTASSDIASLEVLSWEEVEKKVENAMQMSFEFFSDDLVDVGDGETKILPSSSSIISPLPTAPKPIIRPPEIARPSYDPDPGAIFHKELSISPYQPKPTEIAEIEPLLSEMVIIPGGMFYRGSSDGSRDESPRHKVTLHSFAMDIHAVTNEQFVRFIEAMGGEKDSNNNDIIRLRDSRIKRSNGKLIIESGYARHPVVGVTWYGASAYAKWVGKRLPSEVEWEIAAAGGLESSPFPTGPDIDHTQANFFNTDTTQVMSYPSNGYGLFDMVGNVYEWCQDWYAYNFYEVSMQEPDNPKGPMQGVYRVLRGGCWKSLKEDLRISHRHRNNPGAFNGTYGFRCAADVS